MYLSDLIVLCIYSFALINCFVSSPLGTLLLLYNLCKDQKIVYTITIIYLTLQYNNICTLPKYFCLFDKFLYRSLLLSTIYNYFY